MATIPKFKKGDIVEYVGKIHSVWGGQHFRIQKMELCTGWYHVEDKDFPYFYRGLFEESDLKLVTSATAQFKVGDEVESPLTFGTVIQCGKNEKGEHWYKIVDCLGTKYWFRATELKLVDTQPEPEPIDVDQRLKNNRDDLLREIFG